MIDLGSWPQGSRLILRKERPHPGAQLTFTDADGHRVTALLTDTEDGVIPGQLAGLELRHRQHARVEDRIREAKATGLRNLPCRGFAENSAWLEAILTAIDLYCWTKLIGFTHLPSLAKTEIATFRYRILHTAAQLVHSGRQLHLHIEEDLAMGHRDRRRVHPNTPSIQLTGSSPPTQTNQDPGTPDPARQPGHHHGQKPPKPQTNIKNP